MKPYSEDELRNLTAKMMALVSCGAEIPESPIIVLLSMLQEDRRKLALAVDALQQIDHKIMGCYADPCCCMPLEEITETALAALTTTNPFSDA